MQTHDLRYANTLMNLRHKNSRVEIKHYSVTYFYHITTFEALQRRTSVKGGGGGGAHTCRVDI